MGPSGVGKDSLIAYCRAHLKQDCPVAFAHRYITRPAQAGHENYISLSDAEFDLRRHHGIFLFDWAAHGYRYGAGLEVGTWLEKGLSVLLNGSRAYLPCALERMPDLVQVYISAPQDVLRGRLMGRSRETDGDVALRLARLPDYIPSPECFVIDNSWSLDEAGQQLLGLLEGLSRSHKEQAKGQPVEKYADDQHAKADHLSRS